MNRTLPARFDWRGWRSAIAQRLDRQTIVAALAFVAAVTAFSFVTSVPGMSARGLLSNIAMHLIIVMVTLLVLAVALVAADRGVSSWVAYPLAACIAVSTGFAAQYAFDPHGFLARMPNPQWAPSVFFGHLVPVAFAAVFYVYQSNAAQRALALQRLESERAAQAERLASERLRAELATIDHDLVLTAMRAARASPANAETLLTAVSTYLRAAQQRESSDAERVATSLDELRRLCAGCASGPAQQVAA